MSDLKESGFEASDIIVGLGSAFAGLSEAQKKAQIKKTNGIFELRVSKDKQEAVWTIDLKKEGTVKKGPATGKPDVVILLSDETFTELATGKLNGQKAFMTGKLKSLFLVVRGKQGECGTIKHYAPLANTDSRSNMMMATKLEGVLKLAKPQAKL